MAPRRRHAGSGAKTGDGHIPHNQCMQPCTISGSLPSKVPIKSEYAAYLQDLCLCPSMISPFEAVPAAQVGRFQACNFALMDDFAFRPSCPCVACASRRSAAGYRAKPEGLFYAVEPLVKLAASCLCHPAVPPAGLVKDAEVQTLQAELVEMAVQTEGLADTDIDMPDAKVADCQVGHVQVTTDRKSGSWLRRARRAKLKAFKADKPLPPFPPDFDDLQQSGDHFTVLWLLLCIFSFARKMPGFS